jgi:hypothetical protein
MQYLVSLLVPPVLFLLARRRWSLLRTAIASIVLTYGVIVAAALGMSAWYSHRADAYDLNRDGVITLAEQSPAQSAAQELAVNDAGRNLSVLFAVPWAVLVCGLFFGLVAVFRWLSRKQHQRLGSAAMSAQPGVAVGSERDA